MADAPDSSSVVLGYVEQNSTGSIPDGSVTATLTVNEALHQYTAASGLDVFHQFQTVLIAGFANAANNGYKIIAVEPSATTIYVLEDIGGDETNVANCTIKTALTTVRMTGESLNTVADGGIALGDEIRADCQSPYGFAGSTHVAGEIRGELMCDAWDDFLKAALCADRWHGVIDSEVVSYTAATIAINASGILSDSAAQFVAEGFEAGKWIRISGFTEAGNTTFAKITGVAANQLVIEFCGTIVTEGAGATVTIKQLADVVIGSTKHKFLLERTYGDNTKLARFVNVLLSGMTISSEFNKIATITFPIVGTEESTEESSCATGTAKTFTNQAFFGTDGIHRFSIRGWSATYDVDFKTFTLTLTRNWRQQNIVNTKEATGYGANKVLVSGNFTAYYDPAPTALHPEDWFATFTLGAEKSLAIIFGTITEAFVIDLPALKYTGAPRNAENLASDIIVNVPFEAYMDEEDLTTIRIAKYPA